MLAKVVIDYENHSNTEQLLQRNKEINLENSQLRPWSVHTYVIQMNKFANTIKAKMKLQKHVKNTRHQANHRDKNSDIANKRKNRGSFKLESSSRYYENIYKTAPKATNWPGTNSRNQNAQKQGANIAYAFS